MYPVMLNFNFVTGKLYFIYSWTRGASDAVWKGRSEFRKLVTFNYSVVD